jgi:hypothetical protein
MRLRQSLGSAHLMDRKLSPHPLRIVIPTPVSERARRHQRVSRVKGSCVYFQKSFLVQLSKGALEIYSLCLLSDSSSGTTNGFSIHPCVSISKMFKLRVAIPTDPFGGQALSGPIYARFLREWAELASRTGGICSAAAAGPKVTLSCSFWTAQSDTPL